MPSAGGGKYNLQTCRVWISANVKPTGRGDGDNGGLDRGYWETRKVKEQALQERIKRKQLEGSLIEVDVVARHNERRIAHAKALFEQVPDRVLGLLPKTVKSDAKRTVRDRVAEMVEDILFALSAEEADDQAETPKPFPGK